MNTLAIVFLLFQLISVLQCSNVESVFSSSSKQLDGLLSEKEKVKALSDSWNRYSEGLSKIDKIRDMSVECALCGIVINEVAGFLIENRTISEIETLIQQDVCNHLGVIKTVCDLLVDALPLILSQLENQWSVSVVCVDLKLCTVPFNNQTDPRAVPTYTINLDLDPIDRWTQICSVPTFQQMGQYLYNVITTILPDTLGGDVEKIGQLLNDNYYPYELSQEIRSCANQMGVPYGWIALFNLGYEVSDACTSIVAQTMDGKIYHARNLDFWAGMGFTETLKDMTIQVDYQKGGKTVFTVTTFAGMVGTLSGIRPGAFSGTVDTRFYPGGVGELFYEVIAAIEERNASLVSFLLRDVLQNQNDYPSALENLSNDELIADVYYILAGVSAGQGAVISRNRTDAADVWILDAPTRWFEIETNYDHWEPAPWFDDRIDPANNAMNAIPRSELTLEKMFQVLTTKPVFNLQTTYTILSCPATGEYQSFTRYCPYPCVE
eukprot:TRINITY_DN5945_c0_g1_i1.p1 TRINITY_DN5945_c0_g1~~TRINITY_DN5945_c0_g1_i1.p1  ORF type:complete len:493 (-),score=99.21 TRINITY_DN5945_c0_g1_i1:32-1510(-)